MNRFNQVKSPKETILPKSDFSGAVGIVLNLANLLLISYLVWKLSVLQLPGNIVMQEYLQIRNSFYLTYAGLFIVIGLFIASRKASGSVSPRVTMGIPEIIINLIFTTFSFALASLIADLLHRS